MGPRPSPHHSIERQDVNGDYAPSNVVWATADEQSANKRNTVFVIFEGERRKLIELVRQMNIPRRELLKRVRKTAHGLELI